MRFDTPLIGRGAELSLLKQALIAAEKGHGRVIFLSGEGGVGKTRLATAAAEIAEKNGWLVAVGRAYPVETGMPYALFSDALLPVIRKLDQSALSVLSRGGNAELAYLFPPLAGDTRKNVDAGLDAAEFKARLLSNFSQFLGRLSAKQPILIVLDNLQWADASSLELLHFVARHLENQKIVLLCTYNEAERDANASLRTTEHSLDRLGLLTVERLRPLTEENVSELVKSMFAPAEGDTKGFSNLLFGWTRGNAFFIEETLKTFIQSGRLILADGRWRGFDLQTFEMPLTVRDAVAARVARLSAPAKTLANLAAVIGARAEYDSFLAVSAMDERSFVACIEELCSERVIEESKVNGDAAYDFTHPLVQQVLYSGLGHARATMIHGEIAEALENRYGASALDHADELAFHFGRAKKLGSKGINYLVRAGENALEKYANREAAAYLTSALEAVKLEGAQSSELPKEKIITALARALQRLGEYERAIELWTLALGEAERRADVGSISSIEYRIGLAMYWIGRHEDAISHYTAGLSAADSAHDAQQGLRLRMARGICLQELGRLEAAQADLEFALEGAARGGLDSQVLLARAHRALLLLYAWTGPLDVARKHGEDAVRHAEASGQPLLQWSAHWAMAILAGISGDEPGVALHIAESARLAEESRSPLLPLWTAEVKVLYLSNIGDWDGGLALAERTIVQAQKLGQRAILPRLYVWAGMMYLPRGEMERAKKYFDQAWKISGADKGVERPLDVPSVVPAHLGLAAYSLALGDSAKAVEVGEAGLAIADRTGHAIWGLQWLLPLICEATLLKRDFAHAEELSKRMRADAARLQHRLGLAFSDACDALLVLYRDRDPARAIALLRSAADQFDSIPLPVQSARVRRRLAYALMDSGQPEEGMRELKRAHEVFVKLQATRELDATREALRELGIRPPSRTTVPGAAGLTSRETEIALMVAARKSNKEIGVALKISSRTVSTHLSNIFLKLGVESRGELADFVRELGLTT
ncbi:MAG: AAA family ATPase [Gemmatimonadaceae bacterium]|nr:AAA family ATPase [Gemmatimonadaceae bacterium]